jgi:hypothetical protein
MRRICAAQFLRRFTDGEATMKKGKLKITNQ